jgi:hypothetical protein
MGCARAFAHVLVAVDDRHDSNISETKLSVLRDEVEQLWDNS